MKFNIDVYFFNKFGKLVKKYLNVEPGKEKLESGGQAQFVVEFKSKELRIPIE